MYTANWQAHQPDTRHQIIVYYKLAGTPTRYQTPDNSILQTGRHANQIPDNCILQIGRHANQIPDNGILQTGRHANQIPDTR